MHYLNWVEDAPADRPAIADGQDTLTYGDLRSGARALGAELARTHGRGRFLLIPATRSTGFVRALLAVSYSGNVPVPVDPLAPAGALQELGARCGDWVLLRPEAWVPTGNREVDHRDPALPALVLFTSGTSGIPKGVAISHANLHHSVLTISDYLGYAERPSAAVVLPLHYSYALISQVLCMFSVAGFSRLFDSFRNPIKFARVVNDLGLQTFCGVPSTYQALCALRRMTPLEMAGVRVICSAGAALDRTLLPEIKAVFPGATFFDNYGMTEAAPRISFIREDDPRFREPTCGRPMAGVEVRVLDEHGLVPLADGATGIVAIRGPNVFDGYLNDPRATAEAFTADGFLLSGDLGYVRDGYIYIQGRRDDVFNVGGEKVAPMEIERVLARHPAIEACAVAKLPDPQRGLVPAAYVKLAASVSKRDLTAFLGEHLPPGKVPLRFFQVQEFPLTANGKLQRSRLAGLAESGSAPELA